MLHKQNRLPSRREIQSLIFWLTPRTLSKKTEKQNYKKLNRSSKNLNCSAFGFDETFETQPDSIQCNVTTHLGETHSGSIWSVCALCKILSHGYQNASVLMRYLFYLLLSQQCICNAQQANL